MGSYTAILSLYVGFCRYIRACFDVLENDVKTINFKFINRPKNQSKLHKRLIELIKNHSEIVILMKKFQKIVSRPIFKKMCIFALYVGHALNTQVNFETILKL